MPAAKPAPYGYAGWSATARFLTQAAGRPVTRQLVRSWWLARERNGFPDLHDGALNLEQVLSWYTYWYLP